MKFCAYCGSQIFDNDRNCPCCGGPIINYVYKENNKGIDAHNSLSALPVIEDRLEEFNFISGTSVVLKFNLYDTNNDYFYVDGDVIWNLSPYGEPHKIIIQKKLVLNNENNFELELKGVDTRGKNGKFVQYININTGDGLYTMKRGMINIIPGLL